MGIYIKMSKLKIIIIKTQNSMSEVLSMYKGRRGPCRAFVATNGASKPDLHKSTHRN